MKLRVESPRYADLCILQLMQKMGMDRHPSDAILQRLRRTFVEDGGSWVKLAGGSSEEWERLREVVKTFMERYAERKRDQKPSPQHPSKTDESAE